jgi:peptidoglycan LD-endopeptidase LytH
MEVTLPILRVRPLASVFTFGHVLVVSAIAVLAAGCVTTKVQVRPAPVVVTPEPASYVEPKPVHKTEAKMAAVPQLQFMPVKGVTQKQIKDNFGEHRNGGRTHKGIDIFAPSGRELLAVTSGYVERTSSKLGGTSIYLRGDNGLTYYYAHLSKYHSKANSGDRVQGGQVVGYVGNTGNARYTPAHLHFEIRRQGIPFNPYYTLRDPDLVVTPLGASTPVEYAEYHKPSSGSETVTAPVRVAPARNTGGAARVSTSAVTRAKTASKPTTLASKATKKSATTNKLAAKKERAKKKEMAVGKALKKRQQAAKKSARAKKKYAAKKNGRGHGSRG